MILLVTIYGKLNEQSKALRAVAAVQQRLAAAAAAAQASTQQQAADRAATGTQLAASSADAHAAAVPRKDAKPIPQLQHRTDLAALLESEGLKTGAELGVLVRALAALRPLLDACTKPAAHPLRTAPCRAALIAGSLTGRRSRPSPCGCTANRLPVWRLCGAQPEHMEGLHHLLPHRPLGPAGLCIYRAVLRRPAMPARASLLQQHVVPSGTQPVAQRHLSRPPAQPSTQPRFRPAGELQRPGQLE